MKPLDLIGKKFNYLTVLERVENTSNGRTIWKCQCDCGNIAIVRGSNLVNGSVKSCGCLLHYAAKNRTHHMSKSRLYNIWAKMRYRCSKEYDCSYKNYGKRGICVCEDWNNSFETFMDWAFRHGYDDNLTIERIDNNKGYSPENCKWITQEEQMKNRRSCISVKYHGETKILSEWCKVLGLDYKRAYSRIKYLGWSAERAFEEPIDTKRRNMRTRQIKGGV